MRTGASHLSSGVLTIALAMLATTMGCDGEGPAGGPSLSPVGVQQVSVNEELSFTVGIDNPDGRAVSLRLEAPVLPGFDRVTSLSTSPSGGQFRWQPLASHVGEHELVFVLLGGADELDRVSVLVEVSPARDAAPVFVRPGAGGTYDLTRDPCVGFDIEVRDDDSPTVTISAGSSLPEGAMLETLGPKRARFDWCPSAAQASASERWTIRLVADDGDHPSVEHDYVIVLRTAPKEGCPGEPPVITLRMPLMGERVTSGSGFTVEVDVTDDLGLREPPILYWSTERPEDVERPDVTAMEQVIFEGVGGDRYRARIPPLGLEVGEEVEIHYSVSATDNDDPAGSECDNRTDTAAIAFFAVGGMPADGSLERCDRCSTSVECASGICATTPSGGRCVDACPGDATCELGVCGATVTREGATRAGCGPVAEVCGGGAAMCTNDGRNNHTLATAAPYTAPVEGIICPGVDDYFRIDTSAGERVTAIVDGFVHAEGDLDLQLLGPTGSILGTSASTNDEERVSYCAVAGVDRVHARIFGFAGDSNTYRFRVEREGDACCVDDEFAGDDTQASARSVTFSPEGAGERADFSGTICARTSDWIAVPMAEPGRIEAIILFDGETSDLDLELYGPGGALLAFSRGIGDTEEISHTVASAGTYALRVYALGDDEGDYLGEVRRFLGSPCGATMDCPVGAVCDEASCRDDDCASSPCPSGHVCATGGPVPAAPRCGETCGVNSDCRSPEACKWFPEGRACGRRGSQPNGASCASFADCGGQRACVAWPGGYCARAGCTDNADCESGTFCIEEGGLGVCALHCVTDPDLCRVGYDCDLRPSLGGTSRFVCVPD